MGDPSFFWYSSSTPIVYLVFSSEKHHIKRVETRRLFIFIGIASSSVAGVSIKLSKNAYLLVVSCILGVGRRYCFDCTVEFKISVSWRSFVVLFLVQFCWISAALLSTNWLATMCWEDPFFGVMAECCWSSLLFRKAGPWCKAAFTNHLVNHTVGYCLSFWAEASNKYFWQGDVCTYCKLSVW